MWYAAMSRHLVTTGSKRTSTSLMDINAIFGGVK